MSEERINWYPGHMAKAKRELISEIKLVDLVIELLDARIPYSSANPMVSEIIGNKPRLILLNKASLADPLVTKEWIDYYKKNNIIALDIDSINKYNFNKIDKFSKLALKDEFEKRKKRGLNDTYIKALIIGIPNVGKSTLINSLSNKKKANVGNKPGVTKQISWIKATDTLYLLDTPGILWPKFEPDIGYNLAICGAIKDDILNIEDVVLKALDFIKINYKDELIKRYNLDYIKDNNIDIINDIAIKKGMLIKGGNIDYNRAINLVLNDIRSLKIGRISYERYERYLQS